MSGPALLLLGSPRIERHGAPVEVDTRKALALAAYLAMTRQRVSRDTLAALLWPDSDDSRAALRRTLSVLNKALGEGGLDIDREHVGLDRRGDVWVDVDHFRRLLSECGEHGHPAGDTCLACLDPLDAAVALYRADFLVGFSLRDSPEFDDWQFFQAEGLRQELAGALERLTRVLAARGQFEAAIGHARRWLALDPLHEPAHGALMELYAWSGKQAAALRQYQTCVRVLARELDVPPLATTTQLYQVIKENRTPRPEALSSPVQAPHGAGVPVPSPSGSPRPSPHHSLVGRAAEWEGLLAAYAKASSGLRIVVLEGEAGIGKTRLAEDFLVHVAATGARTLATRSYEGETDLAYGAVAELLRAAIWRLDHDGAVSTVPPQAMREASRLLPDDVISAHDPPSPLDSPGAQTRFYEGVCHVLLAALGDGVPSVLFLDDAHWADGASLDLLAYLARRVHDRPLFLLLARRDEASLADHRLARLLADAHRAGTLTTIRPARLGRGHVEELMASLEASTTTMPRADNVRYPLPDDLGRRLYEETEGVPLLLREYVEAIVTGTLVGTDAGWDLPGGVQSMLRSRVAGLGEPVRHTLAVAATIGRSFDFDTVRSASGRDEETTVAALEELIARGVVRELDGRGDAGSPTYDFSHEKLRVLVCRETSQARRRLLHRCVAEALVDQAWPRGESGPFAAQIAHHFREAGQERAAADSYVRAGEYARALFANVEALAHFRSALDLGHPDRRMLLEAIGDVQTLLGAYGEALSSYEATTREAAPGELAGVERKRADVYHRRGEWELADGHLRAALTALGASGPDAERAHLHAERSLLAHRLGRTAEALTLAGRALRLAEGVDDPRALAQSHNVLGILASDRGDLDAARRHLEQSVAIAGRLDDPGFLTAALNNLSLANHAAGESERALELAEAALASSAAHGDRHRLAAIHNNLADLLHAAGQSSAALDHVKLAVSIYAEIGVEDGFVQPRIWKLSAW